MCFALTSDDGGTVRAVRRWTPCATLQRAVSTKKGCAETKGQVLMEGKWVEHPPPRRASIKYSGALLSLSPIEPVVKVNSQPMDVLDVLDGHAWINGFLLLGSIVHNTAPI